jgi:hypothetical protein
MAPLEPDRWFQFALQTCGLAIASFAVAQRVQPPGAHMSGPGQAFLGLAVFFLAASLVLAVLGIARRPDSLRRRWKLLAMVAFVVLTVLLGVRFYRNLTDLGQGVLFGIGAMLLFDGLRRLMWGHHLRRKQKRETEQVRQKQQREAEEVLSAGRRASVSRDLAVRDLRKVYCSHCGPAFQLAREFLGEICYPFLNKPALDPKKAYIARLIGTHILGSKKNSAVENRFAETEIFTEGEFKELKAAFGAALVEYMEIVTTIKQAGRLLVGAEQLERLPKFAALRQQHEECAKELPNLRAISDISAAQFAEVIDL